MSNRLSFPARVNREKREHARIRGKRERNPDNPNKPALTVLTKTVLSDTCNVSDADKQRLKYVRDYCLNKNLSPLLPSVYSVIN